MSKHKISTLVAPLKYVFTDITSHPKYQASIEVDTDGPIHEDIKSKINNVLDKFRKSNKFKIPSIKPILIDDPAGTIDPQTKKVQKIPNGKTLITFKTDDKLVFENTPIVNEGSLGSIQGIIQINDVCGINIVSLYLTNIKL